VAKLLVSIANVSFPDPFEIRHPDSLGRLVTTSHLLKLQLTRSNRYLVQQQQQFLFPFLPSFLASTGDDDTNQ
jgi:hypothetical protein